MRKSIKIIQFLIDFSLETWYNQCQEYCSMEGSVKNRIDMPIFHTAVCAVHKAAHDATCVLEAHMRCRGKHPA